jgi:chromosomal replication initiator protein
LSKGTKSCTLIDIYFNEKKGSGGVSVMTELTAAEIWNKACAYLRQVLNSDVYSRWIAVIRAETLDERGLILSVDNDFYQTWLEENYLTLIKNAVSSVCGHELPIYFKVSDKKITEEQESEVPVRKKSTRELSAGRLHNEQPLNAKFTFDSFVVGPSNSFAHAAAFAVAQAPARAYNPLFIYGESGLGKTHLMQAIGHYILNTSRANVCYVSSETFLNDYIDALQNRSTVQFRRKYRNTSVLLIDDIHFIAGKTSIQEEFFHTFNVLFDARKQIVMTSDRPTREITGLEERLVSRFEWGLVAQIQKPDFETRLAILHYNLSKCQIKLADEILTFIAEKIKSNIRTLEGALIRVVSYQSLVKHPLDIEQVAKLLADVISKEERPPLTCETVLRAVAEHFEIRVSELMSKKRPQSVAIPRQIAMYLCRRMTGQSFPEIAAAFDRTHAAVLHAYKIVHSRLDVDPVLRRAVEEISAKLGQKID